MVKKLFAKFWSLGQEPRQGRGYYEALIPLISLNQEQGITKCIHHIYHSVHLPEAMLENIESLRRTNPDYEYKLWTFQMLEEFILENYGEKILAIYHKITPEYFAAKSDLCRYLLIYKLGGVYLDVKSNIDKPLAEVIHPQDTCLLSHWDNLPGQEHEGWTTQHPGLEASPRGEYVQWYLAYSAGHPLLREIILEVLQRIDNYNPFVRSVGRGGVLSTTGPIPYSVAILQHFEAYRSWIRVVELPDLGFVYSIYDRQGDTHQHKKVMPSNYWRLTMPVVPSPNPIVQAVSRLFLRIWYTILDLKWKLSGKEGQRS